MKKEVFAMKNIWVISDVPEYAYELLSKVAGTGEKITAYVNGDEAVAAECQAYGANDVKLIPVPEQKPWEQYAKVVVEDGKDSTPDLIAVAATRRGKTIAAQIAALFDAPYISESKVLEAEGGKVLFKRTIYGGLAEKSVEIEGTPAVVSVAPGTFEKQKPAAPGSGEVTALGLSNSSSITVIERKEKEASSVNLNEAEIVIGVGRGFGKEENLKYAEELASLLGAEIGCSRPVTEDLKWYPEERYIGISGAVIKPKLYIAAGISGQVQHIYGVRESKTIVSIDKNEDAPIFKVSDYYIVGDLEEVLPEIINALK